MNILSRTRSKRHPIIVQLSEFQNRRLLDIRRFFLDQKDGEYKPTRKGIALNRDNFSELLRILGDNINEINAWFGTKTGQVPADAVRSAIQRDAEATESATSKQSSEDASNGTFGDRRYPFPFGYEARGKNDRILMNEEHPLFKALSSAAPSTPDVDTGPEQDNVKVLRAVFLSYFRAARRLEGVSSDGYVDPEQLELEWDKELRIVLKGKTKHT